MDKTLNRVIGYDKKSESVSPPVKKDNQQQSSSQEVPEIKKTVGDESAKIVSWINDHIYFKWSSMCAVVGIDKGNFKRILESEKPVIKDEVVNKIEKILKRYGYDQSA